SSPCAREHREKLFVGVISCCPLRVRPELPRFRYVPAVGLGVRSQTASHPNAFSGQVRLSLDLAVIRRRTLGNIREPLSVYDGDLRSANPDHVGSLELAKLSIHVRPCGSQIFSELLL